MKECSAERQIQQGVFLLFFTFDIAVTIALLKAALKKCKELSISSVLVTCDKDNIGSAKTIMKNGGILEDEFLEDDGNVVQRYWINQRL